MRRNICSENRKSLLVKSCIGAVGLFAALGCSTASFADSTSTNAATTTAGTQNPTLLLHMGISDTSYSSMESHGGDHDVVFRRRHAS
jgi:hypothetical protein